MNIQGLLITVIASLVFGVAGFFYGTGVGKDGQIAEQAKIDTAIEDTRKAANKGAAEAIAKLRVRNTTIQGRVETIIRDNPVYRDCKHTDESFRMLNEALTGKPGTGPTGDSSVPRTTAVDG